MSSGVLLTYFTIQHSMWLTTFTYGFMFGLGTALAYAPPMGVAMRWYPKSKGLGKCRYYMFSNYIFVFQIANKGHESKMEQFLFSHDSFMYNFFFK